MATTSLLKSIVGANEEIQDVAAQQTAPMAAAYDAELAKTNAAKAEQQRLMMEKSAAQDAIMAEPMPERPAVPTPEQIAPKPVAKEDSPMKTIAQMLPILAALGSASTQKGAIMALNASTAAINAMEAADEKALQQSHLDWTDAMKTTLENNRIQSETYNAVLNDRALAWKDKTARLEALATQYGDKLALAALAAGNPGAIVERQKMLDTAAKPLREMLTQAEEMQLKREELDIRRTQVAADIEQAAAALENQKLTVNSEAGQVARKIRSGEPLNERDIIVWEAWKASTSGQGGFGLPMAAGGQAQNSGPDVRGLMAPAAAAPTAPTPAAPAAPTKPAATPAGAPPLSVLKEGQATTFKNGQTWTKRQGKAVRVS